MRGPAASARLATLWLVGSLAACVLVWQLNAHSIGMAALWAGLLCIPLLLPLRGLVRGWRYTYGWATLCVIPYFIGGVTEAVANPQARVWAALCLTLALALFAALILFIRLTAPAATSSAPP